MSHQHLSPKGKQELAAGCSGSTTILDVSPQPCESPTAEITLLPLTVPRSSLHRPPKLPSRQKEPPLLLLRPSPHRLLRRGCYKVRWPSHWCLLARSVGLNPGVWVGGGASGPRGRWAAHVPEAGPQRPRRAVPGVQAPTAKTPTPARAIVWVRRLEPGLRQSNAAQNAP